MSSSLFEKERIEEELLEHLRKLHGKYVAIPDEKHYMRKIKEWMYKHHNEKHGTIIILLIALGI